MKYIRYEIERRKHSPNSLVGVYIIKNDKEENVEKRRFFLSVNLSKKPGDVEIEKLKNFYNGTL